MRTTQAMSEIDLQYCESARRRVESGDRRKKWLPHLLFN